MKLMRTVMAVGAGMAAYRFAQKNNLISDRQIKQLQKRISRAFF